MSETWTSTLGELVRRGLGEAGQGALEYALNQRVGERFVGPGKEADWYFETFGRWISSAAGVAIGPLASDVVAAADLDLIHAGAVARCAALAGDLDETLRAALAARVREFQFGGAFAMAPDGELSSYASYVAAGALDDLGEAIDAPALAAAIAGLANEDGGISHDHSFRVSPTPTTAAGVMVLDRFGGPAEILAAGRAYLFAQQSPSGAFLPGAFGGEGDLLSTATAVVALGAQAREIAPSAREFVLSCRCESGGFAPVPGGPADIEYTYYALLALGALQ